MENRVTLRRGSLEPADRHIIKSKSKVAMLNGLRGMTWAYAVLYYTGLSASTASKKFSPDGLLNLDAAGNPIISNIFYQYLRGERAPKEGPRGKSDFDLVAAVDRDLDGHNATHWLKHPLWEILHPTTTLRRLREIMRAMPDEISSLLFSPSDRNTLYSRYSIERTPVSEIFLLATFDSYIALVALTREGELIGDDILLGRAHHALMMALPVVEAEPVFRYVLQPFFKYLLQFVLINRYLETENRDGCGVSSPANIYFSNAHKMELP